MAALNSCSFIGNVGHIETKYTQVGDPITKLSLAVNETWKDRKTGDRQERTEWVKVTIFGKLAGIAEAYVVKGDPLYVHGKLRTSSYEKDGETRYKTEIIADEFQMLGRREERTEPGEKPDTKKAAAGDNDDFDDDIPF